MMKKMIPIAMLGAYVAIAWTVPAAAGVSALDTRSDLVAASEEGLRERGYTVGTIDGVLDPTSYEALLRFQRDARLPVTGRLDAATFAALDVGIQMSPADPHPSASTVGQERPRAASEAPAKGEYPRLFPQSQTALAGEYPPPPLPGSNRWVEQRLFVRLIEHGIGPDVVVVADNWRVTLTGGVASAKARAAATQIAKLFPGVTEVVNKLEVGENGAAASPDTRAPRAAVRAAAASVPASTESMAALRAHPGGLIEPRWLVGRPLIDAQNHPIGTIRHIWAEPKSGEIQELIVAREGGQHAFVAWDDVDVVWNGQRPILKLRDND